MTGADCGDGRALIRDKIQQRRFVSVDAGALRQFRVKPALLRPPGCGTIICNIAASGAEQVCEPAFQIELRHAAEKAPD